MLYLYNVCLCYMHCNSSRGRVNVLKEWQLLCVGLHLRVQMSTAVLRGRVNVLKEWQSSR